MSRIPGSYYARFSDKYKHNFTSGTSRDPKTMYAVADGPAIESLMKKKKSSKVGKSIKPKAKKSTPKPKKKEKNKSNSTGSTSTFRVLGIDWGTVNFAYCLMEIDICRKKVRSINIVDWAVLDLKTGTELGVAETSCEGKSDCTRKPMTITDSKSNVVCNTLCLVHSDFKKASGQTNRESEKFKLEFKKSKLKSTKLDSKKVYYGLPSGIKSIVKGGSESKNGCGVVSFIKQKGMSKQNADNRSIQYMITKIFDDQHIDLSNIDAIGIEDQRNYSHKNGQLSHALWGMLCTRAYDRGDHKQLIDWVSAAKKFRCFEAKSANSLGTAEEQRLKKIKKVANRRYVKNKLISKSSVCWLLDKERNGTGIEMKSSQSGKFDLAWLNKFDGSKDNDLTDSLLLGLRMALDVHGIKNV